MRAEVGSASWRGWMVQAQAGDQAAYRALLEALSVWLRRYFARRLPPSMVDDAAQDTLMAIHEKRHTYDPARAFEPWVAAIARYKWIDRLRGLSAARTEALPEELPVASHEAASDSAIEIARLLATLRPAQAEVIRLVKLQGHSIEEASARTGQSVALVKVNIHRGLRRLSVLAKGGDDAG